MASYNRQEEMHRRLAGKLQLEGRDASTASGCYHGHFRMLRPRPIQDATIANSGCYHDDGGWMLHPRPPHAGPASFFAGTGDLRSYNDDLFLLEAASIFAGNGELFCYKPTTGKLGCYVGRDEMLATGEVLRRRRLARWWMLEHD